MENNRLVIIITQTVYHPDAIGSKRYQRRFYNLREAEEYYFKNIKDDCDYQHTVIDIYQEEANHDYSESEE